MKNEEETQIALLFDCIVEMEERNETKKKRKKRVEATSFIFTVMNELIFFFSAVTAFFKIILIWIMFFMCNDNVFFSLARRICWLYNCATVIFHSFRRC